MRLKISIFVLLLTTVVFSCKKDPVIENQDVDPISFAISDTAEFVVPSVIVLNLDWIIPGIQANTGFSQQTENTNPLSQVVKDVYCTNLRIEISSPNNVDFSFLKHITLYVKTDTKPRMELAHYLNVPDSIGNSLELVTTTNKLDDYIKADSYTLESEIRVDEIILQDIRIKSYADYTVTLINY